MNSGGCALNCGDIVRGIIIITEITGTTTYLSSMHECSFVKVLVVLVEIRVKSIHGLRSPGLKAVIFYNLSNDLLFMLHLCEPFSREGIF